MMADLEKYPDAVWDRFFDFALGDEEALSRGEVQERLKMLGIDLTKAMSRVEQALQTAHAKEALALAKARRPGLIEAMTSVIAQTGEALRETVRQLIERKFQGSVQAAYFRKLEATGSDEDLQSLLDDMCRLEALDKERDDAEPRN